MLRITEPPASHAAPVDPGFDDPVDSDTVALRKQLPAGASSWTPDLRSCLEAGTKYAWSLRVIEERGVIEEHGADGAATDSSASRVWAEPAWLEVSDAPSDEEVEAALDVLRRRRGARSGGAGAVSSATEATPATSHRRAETPRSGAARTTSKATAPTIGAASLAVSNQVHLANVSAVFKNDQLFLWDEVVFDGGSPHGTTALGRGALQSNSSSGSLAGTSNTAFGYRTLRDNVGGARNTATGTEALRSNTSGSNNTATGGYAMWRSTSGNNNTATGYLALFYNSTASANTATGANSLRQTTTGTFNTATGFDALRMNTTGEWNTAHGVNALRNNTTGGRNTAAGGYALQSNTTGQYNTATGYLALVYNTTGYANTATGTGALVHNTTGHHNTAAGLDALHDATTSSYNTAFGGAALHDNTAGHRNTASGYAALTSNTSGSRNAAFGADAMKNNVSGNDNTVVGFAAFEGTAGSSNVAIGSGALGPAAISFNVAIGDEAGSSTNGSSNILMNSLGVAGESNVLRIGGGTGTAVRDLDKTFIHGISGRTVTGGAAVFVNASGQLGTSTSSRRFKEDIRDLDSAATERLLQLRPVSFRYKSGAVTSEDRPIEVGLIAEEVAKVYPELVVYDDEGNPFTIRYHHLSTLLLDQVQELHAALVEQRRVLEDVHREAAATRSMLAATQNEVTALRRQGGSQRGSFAATFLGDRRAAEPAAARATSTGDSP